MHVQSATHATFRQLQASGYRCSLRPHTASFCIQSFTAYTVPDIVAQLERGQEGLIDVDAAFSGQNRMRTCMRYDESVCVHLQPLLALFWFCHSGGHRSRIRMHVCMHEPLPQVAVAAAGPPRGGHRCCCTRFPQDYTVTAAPCRPAAVPVPLMHRTAVAVRWPCSASRLLGRNPEISRDWLAFVGLRGVAQ